MTGRELLLAMMWADDDDGVVQNYFKWLDLIATCEEIFMWAKGKEEILSESSFPAFSSSEHRFEYLIIPAICLPDTSACKRSFPFWGTFYAIRTCLEWVESSKRFLSLFFYFLEKLKLCSQLFFRWTRDKIVELAINLFNDLNLARRRRKKGKQQIDEHFESYFSIQFSPRGERRRRREKSLSSKSQSWRFRLISFWKLLPRQANEKASNNGKVDEDEEWQRLGSSIS